MPGLPFRAAGSVTVGLPIKHQLVVAASFCFIVFLNYSLNIFTDLTGKVRMATENTKGPGRLISHFTSKYGPFFAGVYRKKRHFRSPGLTIHHRDRERQSAGWAELWEFDESNLWDRGKPSPALIDLVESRSEVLPRPSTGRRLKAFVPVSHFTWLSISYALLRYLLLFLLTHSGVWQGT